MTGTRASSAQATALLATRSADKAAEVLRILAPVLNLDLRSLDDLGIPVSDDEDNIEVFETFRENAIAKASYFARLTGLPVITDDSGIVVHALDGQPGVRSKRFARSPGLEGLDLDRANNERLLRLLDSVPDAPRTAHYACAAVFLEPGHAPVCAVGSVHGTIARHPMGAAGFGYDPLFILPSLGRTFAQVDAATKDRHSHRGRAFRALAAVASIPLLNGGAGGGC